MRYDGYEVFLFLILAISLSIAFFGRVADNRVILDSGVVLVLVVFAALMLVWFSSLKEGFVAVAPPSLDAKHAFRADAAADGAERAAPSAAATKAPPKGPMASTFAAATAAAGAALTAQQATLLALAASRTPSGGNHNHNSSNSNSNSNRKTPYTRPIRPDDYHEADKPLTMPDGVVLFYSAFDAKSYAGKGSKTWTNIAPPHALQTCVNEDLDITMDSVPASFSPYTGIAMNTSQFTGPLSSQIGVDGRGSFSFFFAVKMDYSRSASILSPTERAIEIIKVYANTFTNNGFSVFIESPQQGAYQFIQSPETAMFPTTFGIRYGRDTVMQSVDTTMMYSSMMYVFLLTKSGSTLTLQMGSEKDTHLTTVLQGSYRPQVPEDVLLSNRKAVLNRYRNLLGATFAAGFYPRSLSNDDGVAVLLYFVQQRYMASDLYKSRKKAWDDAQNAFHQRTKCPLDVATCNACSGISDWSNVFSVIHDMDDACRAALGAYCTANPDDATFCACFDKSRNNASMYGSTTCAQWRNLLLEDPNDTSKMVRDINALRDDDALYACKRYKDVCADTCPKCPACPACPEAKDSPRAARSPSPAAPKCKAPEPAPPPKCKVPVPVKKEEKCDDSSYSSESESEHSDSSSSEEEEESEPASSSSSDSDEEEQAPPPRRRHPKHQPPSPSPPPQQRKPMAPPQNQHEPQHRPRDNNNPPPDMSMKTADLSNRIDRIVKDLDTNLLKKPYQGIADNMDAMGKAPLDPLHGDFKNIGPRNTMMDDPMAMAAGQKSGGGGGFMGWLMGRG